MWLINHITGYWIEGDSEVGTYHTGLCFFLVRKKCQMVCTEWCPNHFNVIIMDLFLIWWKINFLFWYLQSYQCHHVNLSIKLHFVHHKWRCPLKATSRLLKALNTRLYFSQHSSWNILVTVGLFQYLSHGRLNSWWQSSAWQWFICLRKDYQILFMLFTECLCLDFFFFLFDKCQFNAIFKYLRFETIGNPPVVDVGSMSACKTKG